MLVLLNCIAVQYMDTKWEAFTRVLVYNWGLGWKIRLKTQARKPLLRESFPPGYANWVSRISQILNFTDNFLCYFILQLHAELEHISEKHYSSGLDLRSACLSMCFLLMGICHELMAGLTAPRGGISEITTSFGNKKRCLALQISKLRLVKGGHRTSMARLYNCFSQDVQG